MIYVVVYIICVIVLYVVHVKGKEDRWRGQREKDSRVKIYDYHYHQIGHWDRTRDIRKIISSSHATNVRICSVCQLTELG